MKKSITYPQALEMAFIDCPVSWSISEQDMEPDHDVIIQLDIEDDDDYYYVAAAGHTWEHCMDYPLTMATRLNGRWFFDRDFYGDDEVGYRSLVVRMNAYHREAMRMAKLRDEDRRKKYA